MTNFGIARGHAIDSQNFSFQEKISKPCQCLLIPGQCFLKGQSDHRPLAQGTLFHDYTVVIFQYKESKVLILESFQVQVLGDGKIEWRKPIEMPVDEQKAEPLKDFRYQLFKSPILRNCHS
jgi:hypothetical protein